MRQREHLANRETVRKTSISRVSRNIREYTHAIRSSVRFPRFHHPGRRDFISWRSTRRRCETRTLTSSGRTLRIRELVEVASINLASPGYYLTHRRSDAW